MPGDVPERPGRALLDGGVEFVKALNERVKRARIDDGLQRRQRTVAGGERRGVQVNIKSRCWSNCGCTGIIVAA